MASNWFLRAGVVFALIGMAMGIVMGATHDFSLAPVHAHVNLIGWVSMFLAGLYYEAHPNAGGRFARRHFAVATSGLALLAPGIVGSIRGLAWAEPVVGAGSVLTIASMAMFALVVFRETRRSAVRPPSVNPAGEVVGVTAP